MMAIPLRSACKSLLVVVAFVAYAIIALAAPAKFTSALRATCEVTANQAQHHITGSALKDLLAGRMRPPMAVITLTKGSCDRKRALQVEAVTRAVALSTKK
jgi:hypothetical protein